MVKLLNAQREFITGKYAGYPLKSIIQDDWDYVKDQILLQNIQLNHDEAELFVEQKNAMDEEFLLQEAGWDPMFI